MCRYIIIYVSCKKNWSCRLTAYQNYMGFRYFACWIEMRVDICLFHQ